MTSNTDHTPGPWAYYESTPLAGMTGLHRVVHGSGIQVASIFPAVTADEEMMVEANANLIAAAPELLAALQDLVPRCMPHCAMGCSRAMDAIALATGGAA